MDLGRLLIEEHLQLIRSENAICVHIEDAEPIVDALGARFVFLRNNEMHKIAILHGSPCTASHCLISVAFDDALAHNRSERIIGIFQQIFGGQQLIVIFVQLPEFVVNHIKVFVAEVVEDFINVCFRVQRIQNLHKIRLFELAQMNLAILVGIDLIENSTNYRLNVSSVELDFRLFEEAQPIVVVQDLLQQSGEVGTQQIMAILVVFQSLDEPE
mmetsp:Transcript_56252/g.89582  ORF Transcript_56252/g.89582 Transcript_56252/m.89582 type:complete len:214 (+) Transcript_56252:261-902(+)